MWPTVDVGAKMAITCVTDFVSKGISHIFCGWNDVKKSPELRGHTIHLWHWNHRTNSDWPRGVVENPASAWHGSVDRGYRGFRPPSPNVCQTVLVGETLGGGHFQEEGHFWRKPNWDQLSNYRVYESVVDIRVIEESNPFKCCLFPIQVSEHSWGSFAHAADFHVMWDQFQSATRHDFCSQKLRISGWWFEPLWKILVNWKDYSQYMGK